MELIALGTYGPYPKEGTATSGYLLKVNGSYYLFDMGSGVYARLDQVVKDLKTLRAVFLTHLHFDHISDISVFKYAVGFKKERGLIDSAPKLFHPSSPEGIAAGLVHGDSFEHHVINTNTVYRDENVVIRFYPMNHPVETYGVRVEAQGKLFAYTSDTAYHENLESFVQGADLLVINCGYQNKDKPFKPNHLTSEEVVKLVQGGQVNRALATHLFAENDKSDHQNELRQYGVTQLDMIEEMTWYAI